MISRSARSTAPSPFKSAAVALALSIIRASAKSVLIVDDSLRGRVAALYGLARRPLLSLPVPRGPLARGLSPSRRIRAQTGTLAFAAPLLNAALRKRSCAPKRKRPRAGGAV